jgi:hypothetical protein
MTSFLQKLHRTVYPHNTLHISSLKRGDWYDVDTKMFEAMFTLLCEYVENECAHMMLMDTKKYSLLTRLKHRWLPRTLRRPFSRKLGLEYLDWMMNVEDCHQYQVDMCQMTKDLYLWYNDEYPLLQDPYETLKDPEFLFLDSNDNPTNEFTSSNQVIKGKNYSVMNRFHPNYSKLLENVHDIEESQKNLIDTKLEDLLAIRRSLWT